MKKSTKKLAASVLAFAMITAMVTGCSSKSSSSNSASSAAESTAPVTINFWTISLQPTFTTFFNDLDAKYQKTNKNVTIKWTDIPYDSMQQKLITAVAGGTAPDVVNLNTQLALTLAGKDALVDLNKEATTEQKSIYVKTLYDSAKIGDSVYAFPWYASPSVTIYNKALFTKAGIELPKTYDDVFKLAKTMKDKTGAYLYTPDEFINLLFLSKIDILDSTKTKAAFNNSDTLSLVAKYKTAVTADIIPKTDWGKWDNELKLFETGKLAIINSSGSSISRIKDEAPDVYKNLGIASPVTGTAGVSLDPLMNVVVMSASKNHTAAIAFANYITNDDNQLAFCKKVAIFPSTTKAAADSYFTSDQSTLEGQARYFSAKSLATSADLSLGVENQTDIASEVNKIYVSAIQGDSDAKTTISSAETKVNKILASASSK